MRRNQILLYLIKLMALSGAIIGVGVVLGLTLGPEFFTQHVGQRDYVQFYLMGGVGFGGFLYVVWQLRKVREELREITPEGKMVGGGTT